MQARPVPFNAPMVIAIYEDRKTNTRRLNGLEEVNANPDNYIFHGWYTPGNYVQAIFRRKSDDALVYAKCPYGETGDLLWVRETWQAWADYDKLPPSEIPKDADILYVAKREDSLWDSRKRHARYMPRWASRITLEITDIRVERLQDITEEGSIAEGLRQNEYGFWTVDSRSLYRNPRYAFMFLWEDINGRGSWEADPWVWVIFFKVHHMNVDDFIKRREADAN